MKIGPILRGEATHDVAGIVLVFGEPEGIPLCHPGGITKDAKAAIAYGDSQRIGRVAALLTKQDRLIDDICTGQRSEPRVSQEFAFEIGIGHVKNGTSRDEGDEQGFGGLLDQHRPVCGDDNVVIPEQ